MQCYHLGFHLQPNKNVVMFLIFVYCFYFCCIPVCWLVPMRICLLSLPSVFSLCNLLVLSFCEPPPDAFQAWRGETLAEAGLPLGVWSVAPLARHWDPWKRHVLGGCRSLSTASVAVPIFEGL